MLRERQQWPPGPHCRREADWQVSHARSADDAMALFKRRFGLGVEAVAVVSALPQVIAQMPSRGRLRARTRVDGAPNYLEAPR
jgi:hypothetical protein